MKKTIFLIMAICSLSIVSLVAQDVNAIFQKATPITWLGLDFTGAKLIGDPEKFNDDAAVKQLMESINTLMVTEAAKFSISKAFDKTSVENALQIADKQNKKLKPESLRTDSPFDKAPVMTLKDVEAIVKKYDFEGKDGIGLLFNVESFNKTTQMGSYMITFVNMKTKTVLLTERMEAKAVGFGLRNYWAGSVYNVLKEIGRSEYKAWAKKYAKK